jgi:hypothetical protein
MERVLRTGRRKYWVASIMHINPVGENDIRWTIRLDVNEEMQWKIRRGLPDTFDSPRVLVICGVEYSFQRIDVKGLECAVRT